jgi:hypothetical protein
MATEEKNDNVSKNKTTEKVEKKEIKKVIIKEDRSISDHATFIKEGYQPTDKLDTTNPPTGNPPSENPDKTE